MTTAVFTAPDLRPAAATAKVTTPNAASPPRCLDSLTLLQGQRSVTIVHNGEAYRLQATRQGKLILTK